MFESFLKPPISFPTLTGSIVTFNSQYALPLKSHTVDIDNVSGVSAIGVSATGLNLWGGNALLQSFINANIYNFVYDTTAKTLTYAAPHVSNKVMPLYGLKANTQYTLILTATNANHTGHVNLQFLYSDNSSSLISAGSVDLYDNKTTFAVTSAANKTLVAIRGANYNGTTTLYYDECCLLEGVKTVDDFEPFGTYKYIEIGQTVNEGVYNARTGILEATLPTVQTIQLPPCPIDTLQGVNNIWADTGNTTLQYPKFG